MVRLAYQLVAQQPVQFVNIGDAVHSTWAGCDAMASARRAPGVRAGLEDGLRPTPALCTVAPPCASMPQYIRSSWAKLAPALGVAGQTAPTSVAEINGNEALVGRCRLRRRPLREWEALRNLTKQHHSELAFGLEGAFHFIMGEPWVRPYIVQMQSDARLNFVACGVNATSTLWPGQHPLPDNIGGAPDFTRSWLRTTELSLRQALPEGKAGATSSTSC